MNRFSVTALGAIAIFLSACGGGGNEAASSAESLSAPGRATIAGVRAAAPSGAKILGPMLECELILGYGFRETEARIQAVSLPHERFLTEDVPRNPKRGYGRDRMKECDA